MGRIRNRLIFITQHIVAAAVVLALLVSAPFANGTMLARSADGQLIIEICSGSETFAAVMTADGQIVPLSEMPAENQEHSPKCPWAAAQMAVMETGIEQTWHSLLTSPSRVLFVWHNQHAGRLLRLRAHQTRGPPIFL